MCNARLIQQISKALLDGPASDAVEKSSKRPRSTSGDGRDEQKSDSAPDSFDMGALFQTVSKEETFPTIGWDLENHDERSWTSCSASLSSFADSFSSDDQDDKEYGLFQVRKRARSGMLRSISIMSDLSLLQFSPASCDYGNANTATLYQVQKLDEVLLRRFIPRPLASSVELLSIAACAS